MNDWKDAMKSGIGSGAAASLLSTAVLAACGKKEAGSPYAPTNAVSHWVWGEEAAHRNRPSARHTLLGFLIHHASATFWAVLYEKWFGRTAARNHPAPALLTSAAMAGLACFVDYQMTPERLKPGYEKRLSKKSLLGVYAAFGLGLALPALLRAGKTR